MSDHDFEFDPKSITVSCEAGYRVPGNLYMLGKACDQWLQKRYATEGRKFGTVWGKSGGKAPETEVQRLARKIREHAAKKSTAKKSTKPAAPKRERSYKPRKRRSASRFASPQERKAAVSAAMVAAWANMTPEARAVRLEKMRRKPKSDVPRHKRPEWLAYKRAYDKKRRQTDVLSPEAIAKRRADARRQYAARDPELRKAQNAERRARHKAKVATLKPLKAAA